MLKNNSRGEMGIGTMITFIALILAATITAGVLLQTSGSIQGKALTTGEAARERISTNIQTVEISVQRDSNSEHRILYEIIELAPGSSPIKLDDMLISQTYRDGTATLQNRGAGATIDRSNTGYITYGSQEVGQVGVYLELESDNIANTWTALSKVDFDLDGSTDYVKLCPPSGVNLCPDAGYDTGNYLAFNLSSRNSNLIYIQITNSTNEPIEDICTIDAVANDIAAMTKAPISSYGYVTVTGALGDSACLINNLASDIEYYQNEFQLTEDLDNDGNQNDYLYVNETHALFFFTNGENVSVAFDSPISAPTSLNVNADITNGSTVYGTLEISGTTTLANIIDKSVTFQIKPITDMGYYVVEYLEQSDRYKEGYLSRGDIAKIYMQTPRALVKDESIIITKIPASGIESKKEIWTPHALTADIVPLYP